MHVRIHSHLAAKGIDTREVERSLWEHAREINGSLAEPDAESLFVFLALDSVLGDRRTKYLDNIHACRALVKDWGRVSELAKSAGLAQEVSQAREGARPTRGDRPGRGARFLAADGLEVWVHAWKPRKSHWRRVEFAGVELEVSRDVFPPRPVSEYLVKLGLQEIEARATPVWVDVGTGSGAVALVVGIARGDARVVATEVVPEAVRCARRNVHRLGARNVEIRWGSLLEPLDDEFLGGVDVISANVPYVPSGFDMQGIEDPYEVAFGRGPDGLDLLRHVAIQALRFLRPHGVLLFQLAQFQCETFTLDLQRLGYEVEAPMAHRPGRATVIKARVANAKRV